MTEGGRLKRLTVSAVLVVALLGLPLYTASPAGAGTATGTCNGQTMWGSSSVWGASTSTLACPQVRVNVHYSLGGFSGWTGYSYGAQHEVQVELYGTTQAMHGAYQTWGLPGWRNLQTYV